MARPKVEINPSQVTLLAQWHCTTEEIGHFFGVSKDTIERRFRRELQTGKAASKVTLRQKQYDLAKSGDKTMLIWLGKQWLGQNDKLAVKDTRGSGPSVYELLKIRNERKKKAAAADAKEQD